MALEHTVGEEEFPLMKTYENHPHNKPHDHVMGWRQYRGGDVMVYRLYIPRGKKNKTAAIMQNMKGPPIEILFGSSFILFCSIRNW